MSPFVSVKQRKFLWARYPDIAKKWAKKYGTKIRPKIRSKKKK